MFDLNWVLMQGGGLFTFLEECEFLDGCDHRPAHLKTKEALKSILHMLGIGGVIGAYICPPLFV